MHVGVDLPVPNMRRKFDAILLAGGAEQPRDLKVPGRELKGIHFAMEFLAQQNHRCAGDRIDSKEEITATGKRVAILGGGDTGADCLGTSHRQRALSVHQLEIMPPVYPRGLDPKAHYAIEGYDQVRSGLGWMRTGIELVLADYQSTILHFRQVE